MTKSRSGNAVLRRPAARRGGTLLRSLVPDPHHKIKMHVAISAAGVFYTEDGGRSWQPRNRGTRADFLPDRHPGFGQCVPKLLPAADGTLLCRLEHSDTCWSNSSRGCRDSRRMIR
jgi:hypothetical protein